MGRPHAARAAIVAIVLSAVVTASPATAQDYPTRQITMVVAFAAGGFADGVARVLAAKLGERLGQNIVIENRGGGGGNIGAAAVVKAQPDGHTLLVTTTGLAINETITKDKGFALDDLKVVAIPAWAPETLSVHPTSPAKTLSDLIAIAKTKPINFGSPGVGTSGHIANAYLFKELAKVEAVHVPFQGGAPAVNAMSGGHIDALAGAVPGYAGAVEVRPDPRHRGRCRKAAGGLSRHPDIRRIWIPRARHRRHLGRRARAGQGQRRDRRQIEQGDQRRHERCPGTGAVQKVADRVSATGTAPTPPTISGETSSNGRK